ncbi:hypothetical protein [Paraburkholderia gardini]|uniref:Uncharacterized protein n=1 Tax=Paraburkholderia gardini TaxID=2823469 RepID=A0ABM8U0G1_9BURK|nr:hypothetical protein [Paraburkholderia gardini]CAG4892269.1 hypothetical protein R54767_01269 [Paraburkholderia gardini]CAG4899187.1 hypothetical protein R69919_02571 [Paraburkholderia gardini]
MHDRLRLKHAVDQRDHVYVPTTAIVSLLYVYGIQATLFVEASLIISTPA